MWFVFLFDIEKSCLFKTKKPQANCIAHGFFYHYALTAYFLSKRIPKVNPIQPLVV